MKTRPAVVAWEQTGRQTDVHTSGQTDMAKLIISLSNFANAPKNCSSTHFDCSSELNLHVFHQEPVYPHQFDVLKLNGNYMHHPFEQ